MKEQTFSLCAECGWLGLCVIACPLSDPARLVRNLPSTPDLDPSLSEVAFQIVAPPSPPTLEDQARS